MRTLRLQVLAPPLPAPAPAMSSRRDAADVSPSCHDDDDDDDACSLNGSEDEAVADVSDSSLGSAAAASDDSDADPEVCGFADEDATTTEPARRPLFASLDSGVAVRERYEAAVHRVVSVVQCTPDDAALLLRHFKWNVSRVSEEYFQVSASPSLGGFAKRKADKALFGPDLFPLLSHACARRTKTGCVKQLVCHRRSCRMASRAQSRRVEEALLWDTVRRLSRPQ